MLSSPTKQTGRGHPASYVKERRMKRSTYIIHQEVLGDNSPGDVPLLSLQGLLDTLDALQPELESQGGLVSVFSIALREELARGLGYDS
jgi:hypothetical protein